MAAQLGYRLLLPDVLETAYPLPASIALRQVKQRIRYEMHVRGSRPEQTTNGRNQLASLTILGMRLNNHFPFPLCALAVPKKASLLVGLKASSSTGVVGAPQDSVLLYFNENRLAAIGW